MTTVPSRLTIFYNADGTLKGATLDTQTVDPTGTFPPVANPGVDLTLDAAGLFNLPAALGTALAAALDANTALKATNAALTAQVATWQQQIASVKQQVASLNPSPT